MDFKSLVAKISTLNDPVHNVAAPELPKSVQLDERAQMRVLAGQTTILAESAKMKEAFDKDAKVGDTKKTSTGGTVTKTKTGVVHKAGNNYSGKAAEKESKKKDESVEESSGKKAAQEKFKAMIAKKKGEKNESVKEGKKPDFLDMDKDGDKKEPMKKAVADKKKGAVKEGMKVGDKKTSSTGGTITKTKTGITHKAGNAYSGKAAEKEEKKKTVKESVERKLTFKEMIKLVQESGGQQQIDPVDTALFAWAQRVATAKFNEGTKAEVYAGLVYERMGGVFEMYDVLAETK
jgi:hypothetical protein